MVDKEKCFPVVAAVVSSKSWRRLEDDEYFKDGNKDSRMEEKRGRFSKKKKKEKEL